LKYERIVVFAAVFTLICVIGILMAQAMGPNETFLTFKRDVCVAVTCSLAASGAFFAVFEWLRGKAETREARDAESFRRIQRGLGVREIFNSKTQGEAIASYRDAVRNARLRVWALGRSNDQFLDQHALSIKERKISHPNLDVRVFCFDPEATVTNRPQNMTGVPLINLFDFPRQVYTSEKRSIDVRDCAAKILSDSALGAKVFFVVLPSYFSMMIVDDIAYFFPYLDDASSNPMLAVDTTRPLGRRLEAHVRQLQSNPLLCREITPEQLKSCASH
jgi:hypothetical protein